MRRLRWAMAAILALAFVEGASAQTNRFATALTGVSASDVKFRPIDTSGALQSANGVVKSGTSNNFFSVSRFFRRLVGPSPTPIIATGNIPAPQYKSVVNPRMPISSTVPR